MGIKDTVLAQYQQKLDRSAKRIAGLEKPTEGWIRTARKALGMSGAQLAKRMGGSRAQISHFEKREATGNLTIKTLERAAEAMGCRFVYAIVPEATVADLISKRARERAEQIVSRTNQHMALEAQSLSKEKVNSETAILHQELMREMPSDLWNDE